MLGSDAFDRSVSVPVLEEFESVHSDALSHAVPNEDDKINVNNYSSFQILCII